MVMVSLFSLQFAKAGDNEITLDQAGNGFELNILQKGHSNTIEMYDTGSSITGSDQTIKLYQTNPESGASENTIKLWHIYGNTNSIRLVQGEDLSSALDTTPNGYDGTEDGGHYAMIDIHGSNNNIAGYQKNNGSGGHTLDTYVWGNYNDVWTQQWKSTSKNIDLTIRNSNNDISIEQRGNAGHSAAIDLSGSYGTDLNLLQQNSTAQSYSLTQSCMTAGGCAVSVTQGN